MLFDELVLVEKAHPLAGKFCIHVSGRDVQFGYGEQIAPAPVAEIAVAPVTPAAEKPAAIDPAYLAKMAAVAEADGCEILVDAITDETWVTAGAGRGVIYRCTPTSCTCTGHQVFGRCKHRAFLLAASSPKTTPPAIVDLAQARERVQRLARNPKTTADWHALQTAKHQLEDLSGSTGQIAA